MNDKKYKPHYKKYKFVPAFVPLCQSNNLSCSAAIKESHKGEVWQIFVNETLLNKNNRVT